MVLCFGTRFARLKAEFSKQSEETMLEPMSVQDKISAIESKIGSTAMSLIELKNKRYNEIEKLITKLGNEYDMPSDILRRLRESNYTCVKKLMEI